MKMNQMEYSEFVKLVDELFDEIIIYDNNYNIVYVNKACERHYGMTKDEMMNRSFYDFAGKYWDASILPYVYETKKAARQHQGTKLGASILTIAVPVFSDDGELTHVVMNVRDCIEDDKSQNIFNLEAVNVDIEMQGTSEIVYSSKSMDEVLNLSRTIAQIDSPCLITGESGVGKSLIGKYIYENGSRKDGPFVHINCAAINKELLESELYGYVKGSFTGARKEGKIGLVKEADGGVLFLDEITEIPYKIQAKLLQFIQEKKFYPVGGTKPEFVDVKIIAATNKDIKKIVDTGGFREDLYYRINVFEIFIPPLRERREDILLLCNFYLNKYNEKYKKMHRFSKEVKDIFVNYSWRGNTRELSHIIERLVVVSKDVEIMPWHLPKHFYEISGDYSDFNLSVDGNFDDMMMKYEGDIVRRAYEEANSTRKLAKKLGITQTRAAKLCRKYICESKATQ
ncbi:transcriptional regulator, TyrR [Dethiosulfatibacter aminovorans DSM 17477]|uniref:HTH-type transcriptional regulatory protein TyrR n=1 Tax=Dethiosulfatibacter aminovorans DSM 17477 TaxID=1121476 RepID=A0A1M6JD03_9FIRM|nr:sigma 54-interacting transcriptional regulator [Dethiosulfatibacter aminovorans]SHJ44626.1 transcriptional regulator, TyrR [Dethiosulfatibacter aminovorans DSM 17477]